MKLSCSTLRSHSISFLRRDAAEQRAQREAKEVAHLQHHHSSPTHETLLRRQAVLLRQKMEEHRRRVEQRRQRKERIAAMRKRGKLSEEDQLEAEVVAWVCGGCVSLCLHG